MTPRPPRAIRVLLAAAAITAAGCDEPAAPASALTSDPAPAIFGTYVLDPAASEDYDLSDRCGVPLSSTLKLEGGTWRSEWRWAPGCREGGESGEPVTYTQTGRLELRGDSITLVPTGPGSEEWDVESGTVEAGTVTIYGHCSGADVYVRQHRETPEPGAS